MSLAPIYVCFIRVLSIAWSCRPAGRCFIFIRFEAVRWLLQGAVAGFFVSGSIVAKAFAMPAQSNARISRLLTFPAFLIGRINRLYTGRKLTCRISYCLMEPALIVYSRNSWQGSFGEAGKRNAIALHERLVSGQAISIPALFRKHKEWRS